MVRKELTPVEGDTKCSIYLEKSLDYEIHSSYVMQIIAEVSDEVMMVTTQSNINHSHPVTSPTEIFIR